MNARTAAGVIAAVMLAGVSMPAQVQSVSAQAAPRYTDPVNGVSLEQAIARALEQEPSIRAARTGIELAQGLERQAGLRPNPSVSFERRDEPGGTDNQTTVGVEWPLDLFRRRGRTAVAGREVVVARLAVEDHERLLAADVRTRFGEVLVAVRDLSLLDELVSLTRRQHSLLASRVQEGASPPLERDLLEVELRRLESDRLLQAGRTDAAMFELKRVLGLEPEASLAVRDTLEALVQRESTARTAAPEPLEPAVNRRADVREAEARVGVAEAEIDRAQREGRFDVTLFGGYMRMDAGFPQLGFARNGSLERVRGVFHNVSAGARVTVPLLNRNQGNVAAAQAERAGAAAAYEAARLDALTQAAAARARDEHAREAVRLYSGGTHVLARQNLDVVVQSYELGRVTVFDVLAEQRRYLEVERAYTDALRAAYEARTALTRALGDRQ